MRGDAIREADASSKETTKDGTSMEPVVATGGKRSQIAQARKARNKPKPLPWVATRCGK
jgi:hypothetical protein